MTRPPTRSDHPSRVSSVLAKSASPLAVVAVCLWVAACLGSCAPRYGVYAAKVTAVEPVAGERDAAHLRLPVTLTLEVGGDQPEVASLRIRNGGQEELLLDPVRSRVRMSGYVMRLSDPADLSFDGLGAEDRFADLDVVPREGFLYARLRPGATVTVPVPPLWIGVCPGDTRLPRRERIERHCGTYELAFLAAGADRDAEPAYRIQLDAAGHLLERVGARAMRQDAGMLGGPDRYVVDLDPLRAAWVPSVASALSSVLIGGIAVAIGAE